MAQNDSEKIDKFDAFTAEGEARDYISLEQARVLAIEHARDNPAFYGARYSGTNLVWEVDSQEEGDDYYEIHLSFRPAGRFRGEPGKEQFIIDKSGDVRVRQLLDEPTGMESQRRRRPRWQIPAALAVAVVALVAWALVVLVPSSPEDEFPPQVTEVAQQGTVVPPADPNANDARPTGRLPGNDRRDAVYVINVDAHYDVSDSGEAELTFMVYVAYVGGVPGSGAPIVVKGTMVGPGGFAQGFEVLANAAGLAEIKHIVSQPGNYGFAVDNLLGDGIRYDRKASQLSYHEIYVALEPTYRTVEDEKGLVNVQIPVDWPQKTEVEEGASIIYASPDIEDWIESVENSEWGGLPGFAIVLASMQPEQGPVTLDFLSDLIQRNSVQTSCAFRSEQELITDAGEPFGLAHEWDCERGGILITRAQFQPSSPQAYLVIVARLVSEEDFDHYDRLLETLSWATNGPPAGQRGVHINGTFGSYEFPFGPGGDSFELVFFVEVIDDQGQFVPDAIITGTLTHPSGDLEKVRFGGEPGASKPEFRRTVGVKGQYTLTATGVVGEGLRHKTGFDVAPAFTVHVQGYEYVQVGPIGAEVPETWDWTSESLDGVPGLYTASADDFSAWRSSVFNEGEATLVGYSAQIVLNPTQTPVTSEFLDVALGQQFLPPNCHQFYDRYPRETFGQVTEVELLYKCDPDGAFYNVVRFDPNAPHSYLVVQGLAITGIDFDHFRRFLGTIEWEPVP